MSGVQGGQNWLFGPPETGVSSGYKLYLSVGSQTQSSGRAAYALNHGAISPIPPFLTMLLVFLFNLRYQRKLQNVILHSVLSDASEPTILKKLPCMEHHVSWMDGFPCALLPTQCTVLVWSQRESSAILIKTFTEKNRMKKS